MFVSQNWYTPALYARGGGVRPVGPIVVGRSRVHRGDEHIVEKPAAVGANVRRLSE